MPLIELHSRVAQGEVPQVPCSRLQALGFLTVQLVLSVAEVLHRVLRAKRLGRLALPPKLGSVKRSWT